MRIVSVPVAFSFLLSGCEPGLEEFNLNQNMYLWWGLCTLCLLACQVRVTAGFLGLEKKKKNVPLVEFMYLVFARMPGESYRRQVLKKEKKKKGCTSGRVYVPCIYTHVM